MEPENKDIEIRFVEEGVEEGLLPETLFSCRASGEASVNMRLLTQEEFDRLEKERAKQAKA
jgi:hypothetical protein